jgi:hypothetical protein
MVVLRVMMIVIIVMAVIFDFCNFLIDMVMMRKNRVCEHYGSSKHQEYQPELAHGAKIQKEALD